MKRRQFLMGSAVSALPQTRNPQSIDARSLPVGYDKVTSDVWIEVKLGNLSWNVAQIRRRAGGRPIMAVIKANGYGHGVAGVARHLAGDLRGVLVTSLDEVTQLLEAKLTIPILHFGTIATADDADYLVRNNVAQALYTAQCLSLLRASSDRLRKPALAHLVIDTGLGRLGVQYREAPNFVETLRGITLRGTMTTFTEDTEFDKEQLRRFNSVVEEMKRRGVDPGALHAASSDAILNVPESYLDMVRPGIMLYGLYPSETARQKKEIDLRPAATWKTRVAYVKTLQPGDSIGYHRPYRAEREETVATLPVGYSDGHRPAVATKADVWLNGRRCPIIAPITANHTIVRIPPGLNVKPADEIELMGPNIPAHELANHAGISVYQMVIGLSAARPRVYL